MSVYPAQVLRTSISSSCWVFARYIFHVLVVYHQYLYQVYTLESDRWVLDRPGRILLVLVANQYMCILSVSIAPFFCQYCWNVDGLGVAIVLVCLRCFICRGVDVGCVFEHKLHCHQRLPFSPSTGPYVGRFFSWWKVRGASFLGQAGSFSCFINGFSSLDPHQLDRYSVGINLQVPSYFLSIDPCVFEKLNQFDR